MTQFPSRSTASTWWAAALCWLGMGGRAEFWLLGAIVLSCVSACAALPDVQGLGRQIGPDATDEPVRSPTVVGAKGTINTQGARSLLNRRWKNSYADTATLARLEEIATNKPLIAGNKLTLLYDGPQTMAAMRDAIQGAKQHINLETYIFDEDAVGTAFADLLIEKQRAGVAVHVIVDAIGTISTPTAFLQRMRDAGIALLEFNPVNPLGLVGPWEPNQRDHRKLLVVDGRVAFTGGVNISSTYANSSLFRSKQRKKNTKTGWRDTHIQVEGPAVAALQWEFLNNWTSQNAPDLPDIDFFPPQSPQGDQLLRVVATEPDGEQEIYKSYILAINLAKTSVHITSAYFVPDPQILKALTDAAARGVDVKLVLPGLRENDLAYFAGHAYFAEMMDKGIRLYQLQHSVLHAKTAVIDSVWSTVGSANIDTRSFLHNYELNLVIYDPQLGRAMEEAFAEDLRLSTEVLPEEWKTRPRTDKFKEWLARKFGYWL